jgi:hypothetical protein
MYANQVAKRSQIHQKYGEIVAREEDTSQKMACNL